MKKIVFIFILTMQSITIYCQNTLENDSVFGGLGLNYSMDINVDDRRNITKVSADVYGKNECHILAKRWIGTIGKVNDIKITIPCHKTDIRCKPGGKCPQNLYTLVAEYKGKNGSAPVEVRGFIFCKKNSTPLISASRTIVDNQGNYYRYPTAAKIKSSSEVSEIVKNLKIANENMVIDIVKVVPKGRYVLHYLAIEDKRILFMPVKKTNATRENFISELTKKMKDRNINFLGIGNLPAKPAYGFKNAIEADDKEANIFFLDNRKYPIFKRRCTIYKKGEDFQTNEQALQLGKNVIKFVKSTHNFKNRIEAYVELFIDREKEKETPKTMRTSGFDFCKVCYSWFVE